MKYNLKKPCAKCPFRTDVTPYLMPERAGEIADALLNGNTFSCHETNSNYADSDGTIETQDSQHCAGAMIMLEHMERPNQMMRLCERLGLYDRTKLHMDSPVYETAENFVEAYYDQAWRDNA